jgi:hypothetical protein
VGLPLFLLLAVSKARGMPVFEKPGKAFCINDL